VSVSTFGIVNTGDSPIEKSLNMICRGY